MPYTLWLPLRYYSNESVCRLFVEILNLRRLSNRLFAISMRLLIGFLANVSSRNFLALVETSSQFSARTSLIAMFIKCIHQRYSPVSSSEALAALWSSSKGVDLWDLNDSVEFQLEAYRQITSTNHLSSHTEQVAFGSPHQLSVGIVHKVDSLNKIYLTRFIQRDS